LLKGLDVIYPNQVWCADITFVPLAGGQTVYLALLFDVFTRMIRGWSLERDMSVKLIDQALDKALAKGHQPEIHHSDQGGQYIASSYCQRLWGMSCRISMAGRAKPWENPFIESTIGRIKDEYVLDEEFTDFQQAYEHLCYVLDEAYNHERPHSSLGYLTPAEFEASYHAQHQRRPGIFLS
jgi:transposase InsO family protein